MIIVYLLPQDYKYWKQSRFYFYFFKILCLSCLFLFGWVLCYLPLLSIATCLSYFPPTLPFLQLLPFPNFIDDWILYILSSRDTKLYAMFEMWVLFYQSTHLQINQPWYVYVVCLPLCIRNRIECDVCCGFYSIISFILYNIPTDIHF